MERLVLLWKLGFGPARSKNLTPAYEHDERALSTVWATRHSANGRGHFLPIQGYYIALHSGYMCLHVDK